MKWFIALLLTGCLGFAAQAQNLNSPSYTVTMPLNIALTVNWPATIAGSGTFTSSIITVSPKGRALFACVTIDQSGTLSIQRYANETATIPIGSAVSQALTSGVSGCVAVNDGMPYLKAKVSVVNGSGSTATVSGTAAGQGG